MRKFIKKELLEVIKMLMDANDTLEASITNDMVNEVGTLTNILTECQQRAIYVGEKVEASEGEGTETVPLLEQYCEAVYLMSRLLQDVKKAKKYIKRLQELLSKAYTSIIYDIPNSKKEIVFLPYKASMWDCLESVWMATKEDPDCNAYVIPIPYYTKNSDGTLAQMHYEGDEYPEYVPIISWEEYNIEERHPDIAYIHNPYDNYNKVTSVHPDFYARNLKKHVDMLVYIPYFVLLGEIPEHLSVLPGTMYANRVIVQSEKEKDVYLRAFRKFEKENDCKGVFGKLEEKFLAIGSPKLDKVAASIKEDVKIPAFWEKHIYKPDGTRKKVIFYNTTVQALLDNNEDYLEKLREVLKLFYERRDDIALLWRPHPLIGTAISSMRPKLSGTYRDIVDEFKLKNYGIYDDTADLYRAIAVSDAYYGDWSSVVVMYRMTGKPCMIQNIEGKR